MTATELRARSRAARQLYRHPAPRASFATDATGSRAHWIERSPSKRAAIETAQTRVPCRGDSASVYRDTKLVYRCWRDVFGFQWLEYDA